MSYAPVKNAKTWDSYKEALVKVLTAFNPVHVLEYGPGESTRVIQGYSSVRLIDTIEHNDAWGSKIKSELSSKVRLHSESSEFKYVYFSGRVDNYELIFIDGLHRTHCLGSARFRLTHDGVVILHDAERAEYKAGIDLYEFKFPVDEGHTMILTKSSRTAIRLSEVLW